jgi:hypothetical protein
MAASAPERQALESELRRLVDDDRASCLWFLRSDL